jgi:hypothetical protein
LRPFFGGGLLVSFVVAGLGRGLLLDQRLAHRLGKARRLDVRP